MVYTTERPIDPQKAHRLADALDAAGVAMLPPASTYPEGVHDALRPVIQEVLGRNVGQNADWIDVAFNLGTGPANRTHYQCYLLEVEDRDGWYEIATHIQEDEDDDALVPATHLGEKPVTVYAKELPALLREVRAGRSNPVLSFPPVAFANPVLSNSSQVSADVDWPDELKDLVAGYTNDFVSDVTGPWAVYDVVVDKYVEKIMRELGDAPYESETASDNFIDRWERGLVEGEIAVVLDNALEGRRRGRAAHHTPVRLRRNPPRRPPPPPPPPPSHTFVLEADPVQQGLFAPSSYEAKPKKRAAEPMFVDERQVDLFAPPPPKKNPSPAGASVTWKKYGPKGPDWEGEWLVSVDGRQFRAWRDPEIGSYWFVPASDTRTSLHGAALDQKSPAVHAGFDREECVRAMHKFVARR